MCELTTPLVRGIPSASPTPRPQNIGANSPAQRAQSRSVSGGPQRSEDDLDGAQRAIQSTRFSAGASQLGGGINSPVNNFR